MNLQKLKELAQKATKGEWKADYESWCVYTYLEEEIGHEIYIAEVQGEAAANYEEDLEYIAAANPQVILEMIEELEELRIRDTILKRIELQEEMRKDVAEMGLR